MKVNLKINQKILLLLYIVIHLILYIIINFSNINYNAKCLMMFLVIVSSLIVSLVIYLKEKNQNNIFLVCAFFFTMISDYLLVVLDKCYELAVISFIGCQVCYFIYILKSMYEKKKWIRLIIIRLLLMFSGIILIPVMFKTNRLLLVVSFIYGTNIFFNMIDSLFTKKRNYLFIIGISLFVMCDICVAIMNITSMFDIGTFPLFTKITYSNINLSWIFYYPSQIILSFSGKKR